MPQEVTCKLPFTTTGLAFAVNDSYIKYKEYGRKIPEHCTIHQLYRYTLAQFEYQCSKLPTASACASSFKHLDAVKSFPKNFKTIVTIIDSYGRFTREECKFWTVAPPVDVHSPHTVRLTNLRAIVEKLSTDGDKDFMNENTLPGAVYNADGVLQNPDDIMPATYNKASFQSDARAAQDAFSTLYKYPNFIADCQFSDEGKPLTLVSTAVEKNGPYDSIRPVKSTSSDDAELTSTLETRDWYSVSPLGDKSSCVSSMEQGILSYCGVWSERLEAQWPDIKVRYPGSSKELRFGASWSATFLDFHNNLRPDFVRAIFIVDPIHSVTCRVPFTTAGLAFAVNNLYATCQNLAFSEHCTIHQLYRYTLVQFEFQCYVVGQTQHQARYYPYLDSFFFMYKRLDSSGVVKAYAENFKSIVTIIDSYGYFNRDGCKFGTIAPPIDVHHPHTVRISNLRAVVEKLAAGGDKDFASENTLPGAIYDAEGVLLNANDIMPADYDDQMFLSDASAVRRALQMLTRDENENSKVASCKFSDKGKPSTLVSTSAQESRESIAPIVGVGSTKKMKIANISVEPRQWYSIHSINDTIMNFGILSYCGVWSESLEKKWPDMKVRNPASAKQLKQATWSVDERFIV